jgi:hypothetical protein
MLLAELDRVIHDSRARLRRHDRLARRHAELSKRLEAVLGELAAHKRDHTHKAGGLLPGVTGQLTPERAGHYAQAAAVRRRLADLQARKRQLLDDLRELNEQIAEVADAQRAYEDALVRKERLLRGSDDPRAVELAEIADRLAGVEADLREQDEARRAGAEAVRALLDVREHLNSAHASATWGPLAGGQGHGGKHGHLESAERAGLTAQRALDVLGRKLASIPVAVGPRAGNPGSRWYVDMFFDNFVTNTIRRHSIAETYDQIEEMIQWLSSLIERLCPRAEEMVELCAALQARRRELLEPAD